MKSIVLCAVVVLASSAAFAQNCTTTFIGNTAYTNCTPAYKAPDFSSLFKGTGVPDIVGAQQKAMALREQRLRVRALERQERAAWAAEKVALLSSTEINALLEECKLLNEEYADRAGMDYQDAAALCVAVAARR